MKDVWGILMMSVVLAGCGAESSGSSSAEDPERDPLSGEIIDDESASGGNNAFSIAVQTEAEVPACTETNNLQLVFVRELAKFQSCENGKWVAIDIKGEKGDPGEDGADGLSIARLIECDGSEDIGDYDFRYGVNVRVTEFSDGSFSLSCMSAAFGVSEEGMDTSTDVIFWANDSIGVQDGIISCVPMYVAMEFDIAASKVTYLNLGDPTFRETVSCTEAYSTAAK